MNTVSYFILGIRQGIGDTRDVPEIVMSDVYWLHKQDALEEPDKNENCSASWDIVWN